MGRGRITGVKGKFKLNYSRKGLVFSLILVDHNLNWNIHSCGCGYPVVMTLICIILFEARARILIQLKISCGVEVIHGGRQFSDVVVVQHSESHIQGESAVGIYYSSSSIIMVMLRVKYDCVLK
ncbi:hypothetical protein TNCV_103301 [Trichonephila clavipes]|nr:hypothetical protein TNCV_103301 [Trichonephila clavipes]